MIEKFYTFGADRHLIGFISEPSSPPAKPEAPAIVFLNAGLLHRVGPYRSFVTLSRQLASQGYTCLRFDLGGIGDSEVGNSSASDSQRAMSDIKQALDFLEKKKGIKKFVLVGLCSGADHAHPLALQDARIAGMVLLDGYGYRTPRYYLSHYGRRLLKGSSWINFIQRRLSRNSSSSVSPEAKVGETYVRDFDPAEKVTSEIQTLINRGTELLYIYTSGVPQYYNYKNQFWDMLGPFEKKEKIDVEYYPLADHTFTFPEDREKMFGKVTQWLGSRF